MGSRPGLDLGTQGEESCSIVLVLHGGKGREGLIQEE